MSSVNLHPKTRPVLLDLFCKQGGAGKGYENAGFTVVSVFGAGGGRAKNAELWAEAMDIDWMTKEGLAQAIPPAYTEHLGRQLVTYLEQPAERAA